MIHRPMALAALASTLVLSGMAAAEARNSASLKSDRECLARAMYFESNRNHEDGMLAVGTIVLNRVESGRYGPSICGVVSQRAQFAPGVLSRRMAEAKPAERAMRVAEAVLSGRRHPVARDVMFFHTANVPFRHDDKQYVLVSGGNAFYRWNRGGDDAVARENTDSLARAFASAPSDRVVGSEVVEAALRPKLAVTPPVTLAMVEPAPQSPEAAPQSAPLAMVASKPRVIEQEPHEVAALAYRSPEQPTEAAAALASLKFKPTSRVIEPQQPVQASMVPDLGFRSPSTQRSMDDPRANDFVHIAWSIFD